MDNAALIRYNKYLKRISRCMKKIQCVLCPLILFPREMSTHCRKEHALNPVLCCIWCGGVQKWGKNEKYKNVAHLETCFEALPKISKRPTHAASLDPDPFVEVGTTPLDLILDPMCRNCQFFDCRGPLPPLPRESYEPLRLPPDHWRYRVPHALTFEGNIQLANEYVQTFLHRSSEFKWYHIMVKAVVMSPFIRILQQPHREEFYALPFWCWCNGGKSSNVYERQHRHMIIASKGNYFLQSVWPHVRPDDTTGLPPNFKCKLSKPIKDWLHLANTIGYLSQRESQCHFSFEETGPRNLQHFYIALSLPKVYKLCIATQIGDGAILDILKYRIQSKSVDPFVDKAFLIRNSWHVRLEDIVPNLYEILPVERYWEPIPQPSNAFMYLAEGKTLYFRRNSQLESMAIEDWKRLQAQGGNCFYGIVRKSPLQLSLNQQQCMNSIRKVLEEYERSKRQEMDHLASQIEQLKAELEYLRHKLSEDQPLL